MLDGRWADWRYGSYSSTANAVCVLFSGNIPTLPRHLCLNRSVRRVPRGRSLVTATMQNRRNIGVHGPELNPIFLKEHGV